jgi:2'-5' RNA ligase
MARLRTFIAIDLGKALRDRCISLQENLARAGTDLKWVEPDNLHFTLLFVGEVNDRDVPAMCAAVADVCARHVPFSLAVEGAGCFPNPRRPRIIWVGIGEGTEELVALHDALENLLLDLGCYRREDRPYTPHVTLGRVKSEGPTERLAAALAKLAGWKGGQVAVREVLVMSSELKPEGPIYTVLSRAHLRGSAGEAAD